MSRSAFTGVETHAARAPGPATLVGRFITVEPLEQSHAESLFAALRDEDQDELLRYVPDPVCNSADDLEALIARKCAAVDDRFFACVDHFSGKAVGYAGLLRPDTKNRVIEVGSVLFTSALQRKRAGTEVIYLLLRHAFEDLGYRRAEWKCDSLNSRSRNAALRYGFSFEGVFRQHMVLKGRNRDTAWFSLLDREWPQRREALETWLEPENFDAYGTQFRALSELNGVGGS